MNQSIEIDLAPMIFDRVEWQGRQLAIEPPLSLAPRMDDSSQLFVLIEESLGIDVFAQTRDQVADEFHEQMFFLWDAFALEAPDQLTPGALKLREALLGRVREVSIAEES